MRCRVTLQQRDTSTDVAGGVRDAWVDVATRWAALERAAGREVWASVQRSARVPAVFRLRYLAGVTPGMRLLHEGRTYDVLSAVDLEGRKAELVLSCEEWVSEGP